MMQMNDRVVAEWSREDILALSLIPKMKATAVRDHVQTYTSLDEYMRYGSHTESLFAERGSYNDVQDRAKQQVILCEQNNVSVITWWDDVYPVLLKEIFYPPAILYVWGNLQSADAVGIGMVGTRHCTQYGKLTAERFAQGFARSHIVVVSGLAYGIDAVSHKAVVREHGITYAVIASGIDCISPSTAKVLAKEIVAEQGAIISEYPCGTRALPAYFPQRNRIISGISQAVVVVESDVKGGSLITAQFALDQNRELFAVPGNVSSDKSKGTNTLIQRGHAGLVQSPDDVLSALQIRSVTTQDKTPTELALSTSEHTVLALLSLEPKHIDGLAFEAKVPTHEVLVTLMELEFKGLVRQLPGKSFLRTR